MHAMISSLFLVVLTLTTITAQCPPQTTISNTTQAIPSGQQQITRSLFINHTIAEQPDSGLIKDAIISTVGNNVTCTNIVLLGLRLEFGDGISWGTVADFVINSASIAAVTTAYDNAVKLPLPNTITPAFRSKFPATGNSSLNVINTSALSSFLINSVAVKNRDQGIQVIQPNGQDNQNRTGIAAQPCQVSQWSNCDGCKSDKNQIVTRQVLVPAVGGGSCPPTQMHVYCDRKCLTDWQIGLISLACFLFLVAVCLCFYCVCIRNRRDDTAAHQRAQQKEKELAMAPVTTKKPADEEKIDVEVPDPVRPSTQLDEPAFHRASADTVNTVTTGPRPTATFHDDDDTAQPTPVDEAKEDEPVPAPAAAPPAGAPRANVVRVHL